MKNIHRFRILFILLIMVSLFSCSNEPNLTGKWQSRNVTLTITKEGDNYLINSHNPRGMASGNFSGKYENGVINIGQSILGNITYSKEKDKLYWSGEEFSRVN